MVAIKYTTIMKGLALLSAFLLCFSFSYAQETKSFWRYSISSKYVSDSKGIGLKVGFPLGISKSNVLSVSASYFKSNNDFTYTKPKNRGGDTYHYIGLNNYIVKFTYEYRLTLFKKFQLIPSSGIFADYFTFDNQKGFPQRRGNGGIVAGIYVRYSISNRMGVMLGKDFYVFDNSTDGMLAGSRFNSWSLSFTF